MDFIYYIRWQDLVDIAILAVVVYNIILMMQGTRTVQIVFGIVILGFAYLAADFFALGGVAWVLSNFFTSIILVIIVLFQADFRNALARMGTRYTFRRGAATEQSVGMLNKLLSVCEHLARHRIGALIVLEKDQGLKEFYRGATQLDALISEALLVALFNPKAPLHDGAVLINRDFRITHAGCILPLSAKLDLSKSLGTRHRAALGLSEESDALILVVSEERGVVSLAFQGKLYSKSINEVREKLFELYAKSSKQLRKEREAAQKGQTPMAEEAE